MYCLFKSNKVDLTKLKYVKVSKKNISLKNFPDFFVLGPPRTGTTWLYENLKQHPEIYMSAPKEVFYFHSLQMK